MQTYARKASSKYRPHPILAAPLRWLGFLRDSSVSSIQGHDNQPRSQSPQAGPSRPRLASVRPLRRTHSRRARTHSCIASVPVETPTEPVDVLKVEEEMRNFVATSPVKPSPSTVIFLDNLKPLGVNQVWQNQLKRERSIADRAINLEERRRQRIAEMAEKEAKRAREWAERKAKRERERAEEKERQRQEEERARRRAEEERAKNPFYQMKQPGWTPPVRNGRISSPTRPQTWGFARVQYGRRTAPEPVPEPETAQEARNRRIREWTRGQAAFNRLERTRERLAIQDEARRQAREEEARRLQEAQEEQARRAEQARIDAERLAKVDNYFEDFHRMQAERDARMKQAMSEHEHLMHIWEGIARSMEETGWMPRRDPQPQQPQGGFWREPSRYEMDVDEDKEPVFEAPPTPLTREPSVATILNIYSQKWQQLRHVPDNFIRFADMPWPVLCRVENLDSLSEKNLEEFLAQDDRPGVTWRTKVRQELLRWHPDKFRQHFGSKIHEDDLEDVMHGIAKIGQFLVKVLGLTVNKN